MSETIIIILVALVFSLIGAFLGNLFARLKQKSGTGKLQADVSNANQQIQRLNEEQVTLENEREAIRNEKDSYKLDLVKKSAELEKNFPIKKKKLRDFKKNSPKSLRILPIKF